MSRVKSHVLRRSYDKDKNTVQDAMKGKGHDEVICYTMPPGSTTDANVMKSLLKSEGFAKDCVGYVRLKCAQQCE